jgi:hypothetical protein
MTSPASGFGIRRSASIGRTIAGALALNLPQGSAITFAANRFSQVLRAEPIVQDQQQQPSAPRI